MRGKFDDNVLVQENSGDKNEDPGQVVDHVEHVLLDHCSRQEAKKPKQGRCCRDERERLLGFWEGKLKITFPFYGKGTGIRKCYRKGREN